LFLEFPVVFLSANERSTYKMKAEIIETANDLFLNLGFKSVTMDDLASEMRISKKTIYTHFQNKTKLVEATTHHLFCVITEGINTILEENQDPIAELYAIKAFVMHHLKNEKAAPLHQLEKYYPKIHQGLKTKQFEVFQECVVENLKRGITQGVFRQNIDIQFISRIYFIGTNGIKDKNMFPEQQFPVTQLMDNYLEYHILGITTEKGRKILNNLIKE